MDCFEVDEMIELIQRIYKHRALRCQCIIGSTIFQLDRVGSGKEGARPEGGASETKKASGAGGEEGG